TCLLSGGLGCFLGRPGGRRRRSLAAASGSGPEPLCAALMALESRSTAGAKGSTLLIGSLAGNASSGASGRLPVERLQRRSGTSARCRSRRRRRAAPSKSVRIFRRCASPEVGSPAPSCGSSPGRQREGSWLYPLERTREQYRCTAPATLPHDHVTRNAHRA